MGQAVPCSAATPALRNRRPSLVSFSGIDGSGKSTQVEALQRRLSEAGFRVYLLTFWDDVAVLGRAREFLSHALFKGEQGVGSPDKPVLRRDKDVQSWYMTVARFVLYFLDALRLSVVVAQISAAGEADVVLFDRYLYDELANLNLGNRVSRAFVRLLLKFVPQPDVACLLDADPVRAHERKPEYRLDFVYSNRASYLTLRRFADGIIVIPPLPAEEVTRRVLQETLRRLPANPELESPPILSPVCEAELVHKDRVR